MDVRIERYRSAEFRRPPPPVPSAPYRRTQRPEGTLSGRWRGGDRTPRHQPCWPGAATPRPKNGARPPGAAHGRSGPHGPAAETGQQGRPPSEGWLLPGRSWPGQPTFLVQILAFGGVNAAAGPGPTPPARWVFATLPLRDFLRAALHHPLIQLKGPVDLQLYSGERADPPNSSTTPATSAGRACCPMRSRARPFETGGQRWLLLGAGAPEGLRVLAARLGAGAAARTGIQRLGGPAEPSRAAGEPGDRTGEADQGSDAPQLGSQSRMVPPVSPGLFPAPGRRGDHRQHGVHPDLQRGLLRHHRLRAGGVGGPQPPHDQVRLPGRGVLCGAVGATARQRPLAGGDLEPPLQRGDLPCLDADGGWSATHPAPPAITWQYWPI